MNSTLPINTLNVVPLLPRKDIDVFKSDDWLFKDPDNGEFYHWNMRISGLNKRWKQSLKHYILHKFGGYKGDKRFISASKVSVKCSVENAVNFLRWATLHHPDKYLVDFKEADVNEFVRHLFDEKMAYGTVTLKMQMLRDTYKAYRHRHIPDGLMFELDYLGRLPKPNSILQVLCQEYGLDFVEWGSRKSHGSIPVYVAMSFLAYAIRDLRSNKTKFAVGFCGLIRKHGESQFTKDKLRFLINDCFGFYSLFKQTKSRDLYKFHLSPPDKPVSKLREYYYACKISGKDCKAEDFYYEEKLYQSITAVQRSLDANAEKWDLYWDLGNDFIRVAEKYLTDEEKTKDVLEHVKSTVRYAALTTMLCLTGSRSWSEICNMRNKDVVADADDPKSIFYTTPIKKTNHGIEEVRITHNLLKGAADNLKLCRLNLDDNIYLFSNDFLGVRAKGDLNNLSRVTSHRMSQALKEYYICFTEAHPEMGEEHKEIKAHQFRHTWAEFALRMFEGNVVEEIRRHFMHSYGSYMTDHYTFNKLTKEVADDLVKKYLKEILHRIIGQELQAAIDKGFVKDLQGIAVDMLSKSVEHQVVTPDRIDDFLDDLADEYVHVKAHEYGYCLSRISLIKHANCFDKESGMPDYDGACYSTCVGCVSFCASKINNEAALIRQSISHQEFAKNRISILNVGENDQLVKVSLKAAKEGKAILNKWKENK